MVLSDKDIKQAIEEDRIKVSPLLDLSTQLGSCSVDFRLGNNVNQVSPDTSRYARQLGSEHD